jgi:AcrR family transcriptional regulator
MLSISPRDPTNAFQTMAHRKHRQKREKAEKPAAPARGVRETLLEAAAEIIREKGIGFVSLREVARRARVSHAAPAHYFQNKSGLFAAFAAHGYQQLAAGVLAAMERAGGSDAPTALEILGVGYVRFAVENPELFTMMFRPSVARLSEDPGLRQARDAAFGVLHDALRRCARDGWLPGIPPDVAAVAAWSIMHGLAALWLSGRLGERTSQTDSNRLAHRVARLFVDGVVRKRLRPPGPRQPRPNRR